MIVAFIPAAGQSSRMRGRDKLLEDVGGKPLLRDRADAATKAGLKVLVGLRADDKDRRAALDGLGVELLPVVNSSDGLGATIAAAASRLSDMADVTAMLILPADMPALTSGDLMVVSKAFQQNPDQITRGTGSTGTPGHPVIFPRRCFADLQMLDGDTGAQRILRTEDLRLVTLPANNALLDLDTPEDWRAWRSDRSG